MLGFHTQLLERRTERIVIKPLDAPIQLIHAHIVKSFNTQAALRLRIIIHEESLLPPHENMPPVHQIRVNSSVLAKRFLEILKHLEPRPVVHIRNFGGLPLASLEEMILVINDFALPKRQHGTHGIGHIECFHDSTQEPLVQVHPLNACIDGPFILVSRVSLVNDLRAVESLGDVEEWGMSQDVLEERIASALTFGCRRWHRCQYR
mmetsp:Transcript_1720/g.2941  ORF Transcript_1720/g.2941 Transcript_1720/m.2941 type:complete len:206 (-) Transcript_1720:105-722(-)